MSGFTMELLTPRTLIDPFGEGREVILQLHGGGYIGRIRNAYRDFAVLYSISRRLLAGTCSCFFGRVNFSTPFSYLAPILSAAIPERSNSRL